MKIALSLFLTLFLVINIHSISAQTSFDRSSMEKMLDKEKGSRYIKSAIDVGKQAISLNSPDDALYFFKKAYSKVKSQNHEITTAIVALEISKAIHNSGTLESKLTEFKLDMLQTVISTTKEPKMLLSTYNIASEMEGKVESRYNKLISKIIAASIGAYNDAERIKKEEEAEKEKSRIESTTIRIDKEQLSGLNTAVSELQGMQKFLSVKMSQNEDLIKNMSRENLIKETLLEKNKRYIDSLSFEASIDSIILDATNAELDMKVSDLKLKESQRNLFLAIAGLIFLIAGFLYYRIILAKSYNKQLEEKNKIIEIEKLRSDELLRNILPVEVAEELKLSGKVKAQYYENASIFFADLVNFSQISRSMTPQELVNDLDYCFSKFDEIVGLYGVEKIKTIGDAYMCIAGVPSPMDDHGESVIHVGLGMIEFLKSFNKEREKAKKLPFHVRIGIHTGPVSAGVVGTTKFVFDVWGDSVNIAARMESSSDPGMINISESTYNLVKDKFNCEPRGAILTKNMGELKMFFIKETHK